MNSTSTLDTTNSTAASTCVNRKQRHDCSAVPEFSQMESQDDPLLENIRIRRCTALVFPQLLLDEIPVGPKSHRTVIRTREAISKILRGEDDRLLVIVGPCSIHDPHAAMEYARKLKTEVFKHEEELQIVMRVYFEKPRTTVGWKGLINDPDLDESFDVNRGLRLARRLLSDITSLGVPVGCEYLDTLIPQYTSDFVSWCAIGARTSESQLHRELASGLSFAVGFKNSTSGSVSVAVDACVSARHPHSFLGTTKHGLPAIFHSHGNPECHIILRGSTHGTNYSSESVLSASASLHAESCIPRVMVDCSHGNSQKNYRNQRLASDSVCAQVAGGNPILGVMIESYLYEGNQALPHQSVAVRRPSELRINAFSMTQETHVLGELRYGVSITDECVGFPETVEMLRDLATAVTMKRSKKITCS